MKSETKQVPIPDNILPPSENIASDRNREQWLNAAVVEFHPFFAGQGLIIPKLHVSCGFPSRSATSNKKRAIGECWDGLTSADKKPQLFISPFLVDPMAPGGVLATLAHEIVHATIGNEAKHGPRFVKAMKKVGLEGKPTATIAGELLLAKCEAIVKAIGKYPHSELKLVRERKVQTTRMLKAQCATCEYTVRLTRKWADVGVPNCPCPGHGILNLDNHLKAD
jgi:hypothetical protein